MAVAGTATAIVKNSDTLTDVVRIVGKAADFVKPVLKNAGDFVAKNLDNVLRSAGGGSSGGGGSWGTEAYSGKQGQAVKGVNVSVSSKNVFRPPAVNPEGKTLGFLGRVCDWGKKKLREAKESLDKNVGFTSSSSATKSTSDFYIGNELASLTHTVSETTIEKSNGEAGEILNFNAYSDRSTTFPNRRLSDLFNLKAGITIDAGPVHFDTGLDGIGNSSNIGVDIKGATYSFGSSGDLNESFSVGVSKSVIQDNGKIRTDSYTADVSIILIAVTVVVVAVATVTKGALQPAYVFP